jgi:cytolysin (calcineurin-like family phosphatase)
VLAVATIATSAETDVTFLVTSDSHYDAFENEDRNQRNRVTIDHMNAISTLRWPEAVGGDVIGTPRGVLLLGDVIDDGDRMLQGKLQSEPQFRYFLADFGLDGTDGRLKYPVFEGWGNHDGPPVGRERFGFSFQSKLKIRNTQRRKKGLIHRISPNGLHYSWTWGGVHFVQLNLYPGDKPHPKTRYSPQYHDPQQSLAFLKADLTAHARSPIVVVHHYDLQGTDWWHDEERRAYYDALRGHNVIAVFHGHTGTGLYQWKPEGEKRALNVINTGQTENGFFVVQITGNRIRLAYRVKTGVTTVKEPDGKRRWVWDGTWGWRHVQTRNYHAPPASDPQAR